jgi:5S rRNA maturation endonuclease (ribonuclease M5)
MLISQHFAITHSHLILCEGKDDEVTIRRLIGDVAQIRSSGSVDAIKREITALPAAPGFERLTRLIVVADCDDSGQARHQSIRDVLRRRVPDLAASVVLVPANPTEPGGDSTGALEDLFVSDLASVPHQQCVERLFECMDGAPAIHTEGQRAKAKLQVLAAVLLPKETRSQLIGSGALSCDGPALQHLGDRLRTALDLHSQPNPPSTSATLR